MTHLNNQKNLMESVSRYSDSKILDLVINLFLNGNDDDNEDSMVFDLSLQHEFLLLQQSFEKQVKSDHLK